MCRHYTQLQPPKGTKLALRQRSGTSRLRALPSLDFGLQQHCRLEISQTDLSEFTAWSGENVQLWNFSSSLLTPSILIPGHFRLVGVVVQCKRRSTDRSPNTKLADDEYCNQVQIFGPKEKHCTLEIVYTVTASGTMVIIKRCWNMAPYWKTWRLCILLMLPVMDITRNEKRPWLTNELWTGALNVETELTVAIK